jgi:hypothetical protein
VTILFVCEKFPAGLQSSTPHSIAVWRGKGWDKTLLNSAGCFLEAHVDFFLLMGMLHIIRKGKVKFKGRFKGRNVSRQSRKMSFSREKMNEPLQDRLSRTASNFPM